MTNYNDGLWHGWNGGECPVHPNSVVEAVWTACGGAVRSEQRKARNFAWGANASRIIAFRVVKEHREPREIWHLLDQDGEVFDTFTSLADAAHDLLQYPKFTLVHYREVVEGGDA